MAWMQILCIPLAFSYNIVRRRYLPSMQNNVLGEKKGSTAMSSKCRADFMLSFEQQNFN